MTRFWIRMDHLGVEMCRAGQLTSTTLISQPGYHSTAAALECPFPANVLSLLASTQRSSWSEKEMTKPGGISPLRLGRLGSA